MAAFIILVGATTAGMSLASFFQTGELIFLAFSMLLLVVCRRVMNADHYKRLPAADRSLHELAGAAAALGGFGIIWGGPIVFIISCALLSIAVHVGISNRLFKL